MLTLADKTDLLEQIKNQPPDTSHRQQAEITGVPKSTERVIQQQEKLRSEWTLHLGKQETSQSGSMKVRIQMFKRPSISGSLLQLDEGNVTVVHC